VDRAVAALGVSERLACQVLGQYRSTQRKLPTTPDDELLPWNWRKQAHQSITVAA
jgi:hypothetical protein